ncbi:acyltransferase domain-containing protein [Aetokthonos hydrillicola Thurmond2011]|jgi:acyl transferase domain-containing protein|uniref:Acyltransferase domain-containing protein n=1 Tax=Aetokthonos hydrillicola Thurmond2011 TaxID=2712845 RepID=A0AAP5I971_9CYAN|nr:type I polyketide synthase [Aetokthonos hydrillicola]MBO3459429.1 acyltransferase domain-containing protein [Aetokthonos hydrillicola CCALA 1050]MBW4583792.1 acyltransferase domain-containing protein [Aetokthonos hydrillicola CCALA 1050]MDR9895513.1 acyltransferase domain-containing protein [Aetokthonos hydrillicola Thurmond2011]
MKQEPRSIDYRSLLEDGLLQIENMQSKLDALEYAQTEPIAIVGMGCRFPGGVDHPAALWGILRDGVDTVTEVPKNRWDADSYYDPNPDTIGKMYARHGSFVNEVETFDASFFNISPREAMSLDPQQRLLLEVSWQALEDSHQVPENLYESPAGVFIGISNNDYARRLSVAKELNTYFGTGNALSTAAGRLSYFLGLTGPCLVVDTACSSSLVAVHLACQSLRKKECSLALAGGVNLLLSPELSIVFSQARMLSPEGSCKTFDADADGYVRGEGCGVIVLKRLSDAIKNQDNILALIRGSAINHDGPSGGLTVPNGPSQQKVISEALKNAGVEPFQVSYIEAHGTGTPLGDPIEVGALGAVFGGSHSQEDPLMIGSLKTNMGHLEAAAGIAGLIKVVLQLQHQEVVPHLHLKTPNPHINWDKLPVSVPNKLTPWSVDSQKRIAGVSSFGFSGTNAHVVLEQAPIPAKRENSSSERSLHLLTLSAKTPKAMEELVSRYRNHLENKNNAELELADICYTANTGRSHFKHRLAAIATSKQELAEKLHHLQTQEVTGLFSGQLPSNASSPKVAFLFTDLGSQYVQMGKQLYQKSPLFRKTIDQCDKILQYELEHPLLSVLYPETTDKQISSLLDQPAYSQPALFAIEYALAKLWQSWGIKPNVIIGNSVGEYVAACVAKVFSLEDGLKLIATRGRLMQKSPDGNEVKFEAVANQITYSQPQIPLISHVTGKRVGDEITSSQYWVNHIQQPVHFAESIQALQQQGCQLFLEIAPKPILLEISRQYLPENVGVWLPSLHPPEEDWQQMLSSLGQLYVKGVKVDWSEFDKDYIRSKVVLPTYPFQRQRYWVETSKNGHQKDIQENGLNPIAKILNQIDQQKLVEELNFSERLTEQEQKLLPKLLKILTTRIQDYGQFSEKDSGLLQQLEKTAQRDRLQLTIHYLQGVVGQLLGLDDSQTPDSQLGFFDMGMDYSMMLKLRNLLETSFESPISVTTLSEHFNIQELAKYLITKVFLGELEEKNEIDNYQTNGELKPLDEHAIENAIKEELIATALQDELKEIQFLLNEEI